MDALVTSVMAFIGIGTLLVLHLSFDRSLLTQDGIGWSHRELQWIGYPSTQFKGQALPDYIMGRMGADASLDVHVVQDGVCFVSSSTGQQALESTWVVATVLPVNVGELGLIRILTGYSADLQPSSVELEVLRFGPLYNSLIEEDLASVSSVMVGGVRGKFIVLDLEAYDRPHLSFYEQIATAVNNMTQNLHLISHEVNP